jgi:hypothetical protein
MFKASIGKAWEGTGCQSLIVRTGTCGFSVMLVCTLFNGTVKTANMLYHKG